MNITNHKRTLSLALSLVMAVSIFGFASDTSLARTDEPKDEGTLLEAKTIDSPKNAEFEGYIVSIKDTKIDQVSETDKAEDLPSTYKDKYYLIETTSEALELASASAIEYMEPNYLRYPLGNISTPDDPAYVTVSKSPYEKMGIDALWENGYHGEGVTVAVLDTGYNIHDDMVSPDKTFKSPNNGTNNGRSYSELISSEAGDDIHWHGTAVSSLIHAKYNNTFGIAGIADEANLVSVNVFHYDDKGNLVSGGWQLLNAFNHFLQPGNTPDVLNMSLGGETPSQSEETILKNLAAKGTIILAAQGNEGIATTVPTSSESYDVLNFPAADNNVIGVSAVDKNLSITDFSNKNTTAAISAWGEGVPLLSAYSKTGMKIADGTSFSTPIVAGIAASLKEIEPDLDNDRFLELIEFTSTDAGPVGWDAAYGYGIINAEAMMNILVSGKDIHKVTFDANGGTAAKSVKSREDGCELKSFPAVSRAGYTFDGWYTDPNEGTKVTSETIVTDDMKLYARWIKNPVEPRTYTSKPDTPNIYSLKLNVNKGKKLKTKSITVTQGSAIGKLPTPKRKGYNFMGWKTKKSGGTTFTSSTIYQGYSDKTLYANWTKKKVVKLNPNGGTLSTYAKPIKKGRKYGSLPTPSRAGYKFKGWYTKKSSGKKITSKTKVKSNKNHTLYARWVRI